MAAIIYNCKACKTGKRVEYPLGDRNRGWFRINSDGVQVTAGVWVAAKIRGFVEYGGDQEFGICSSCFRAMDYGQLKATMRPECPCDGRCTGARGHSCDCSCGGANHGSNL